MFYAGVVKTTANVFQSFGLYLSPRAASVLCFLRWAIFGTQYWGCHREAFLWFPLPMDWVPVLQAFFMDEEEEE